MANQTGKRILFAFKEETTLNTAPGTVTGATAIRLTPGPGLQLRKARIDSQEIRGDGMTAIARHGSRRVEGSYNAELSEGSFDEILQAVVRSTNVAAATITEASGTLGTVDFGTNTVTANPTASTSGWVAAGVRVGDVFRVSGTSGSNDGLNAQVLAVTTNTITVHASAFTAEASVSAFTFLIGKKLVNNTDQPTRRSFYVDQYYQDIDQSAVFGGVRFTGFSLRGSPDGMAELTINTLGVSADVLTTGNSPFYTSPTEFSSDALTFADAIISFGGEELAVATAFELTAEVVSNTEPVIGSDVTPDVFDNELRLSGTLTFIREDLDRLESFIDEDTLELAILLQEPGTTNRAYVGLFIPRLKLMDNDAPVGSDGAMTESGPWVAGLKAVETGYDETMINITTSAA